MSFNFDRDLTIEKLEAVIRGIDPDGTGMATAILLQNIEGLDAEHIMLLARVAQSKFFRESKTYFDHIEQPAPERGDAQ